MDCGRDGKEMTHQWIEEIEFKEMIYEQIEDEEQMTDQWIKEQMEKTDECIELEQEITRMFEKKQKMTIRSTFQTSAGTKGIRMEPASRRPQRKAFSHWLRSKCLLSSGRKKQLGLPTISTTFCCILCIKNVDISSTFLKIYTGWSESELELHCRAWGHRTVASLAKHQRPLASGFSWQFANRKISRGHSLAVAFAVCSSRLNGRKGFQQ